MTQLSTEALAMVRAPADEVYAALSDYSDVRRQLLSEHFEDYRVNSGGQGVGTELGWTLRLGTARQVRKGKGQAWECLVRVDAADGERIVERDSKSGLVATWTVLPAPDGRCVVRVHAEFDGPDGAGKAFARAGLRLGVRHAYEAVLTRLHQHFEPDQEDG